MVKARRATIKRDGAEPALAHRAMFNQHLFELINASAELAPLQRLMAIVLAQWMIGLLPLAWAVAWWRYSDAPTRGELLAMAVAVMLALLISEAWSHLWPQARPSAVQQSSQVLEHVNDAGLPSDHVVVYWSLALAALSTRRFAIWSFPMLALGTVAGWSRVVVGIDFPFDILAAAPVAATATLLARALRRPLAPALHHVVVLYSRCARKLRGRLEPRSKP